jgi:hypothetical protein
MGERTEPVAFLSACRGRVTPADVGLPTGTRRRIPGRRLVVYVQLSIVGSGPW